MQSRHRGQLVLALFFCSGLTALVYEVVWSKFLSQMFGSTIYAQTVVLAAFMGGLALGNRLFGAWADRLRQPVRAYGGLEIAIAVYAFLFPLLDRVADLVFISLGTRVAAHSTVLLLLKGGLSAALLLGPTTLMGGTLPLLAAWLQKSDADAGRRSARFYSVNSLGAVVGAALAGFWLVQSFGLVATLRITALLNLGVGVAAILLSREDLAGQPNTVEPAPAAELIATSPGTLRWAGMIVAVTGAVSMGLEVLSSRALALIFGSSLQSFAIVLMAFILGIGLGSAWIASPGRRSRSSERMIVVLLCVAAAWVTLLVFNLERWVDFYRIAQTGIRRTPVGYVYYQALTGGSALVVLGLPAAGIGAVLPLMIRALNPEGAPLGARVGTLLTWNTLGAVAGTLLTGFVLMPMAGLRNAFGILALALAAMAWITAWRRGWRAGKAVALVACALTGCLFLFGGEGWRHVISSGVFRSTELKFDPNVMPQRKQHMKILFYEDAPDATVSVEQGDGTGATADLTLRINGKPDASTRWDLSTQLMLAHVPMLSKPGAKDVFVLGLGSGMTAGALLSYPVEHIIIGENCEPVIRAARLFQEWNRHVLDDPRTRVRNEDARTVLKLSPQRYDVIITEPSNPWSIGVGSVFSREYYELAASRLKPGGLMAQWFHIYEMQDDVAGLVLRTFSSVFPFVEIWDADGGDLVLLGSQQPWRTGPEIFRQGYKLGRVQTDLGMIDIHSPEMLLARQLASQRTGFAIAGDGPSQSDLFPVLEYAAPRAFFLGTQTRMLDGFDERTRQQPFAPADKRAVLRSLDTEKVQALLTTFLSVNEELLDCMFGKPSGAGVPCVFKTPQPAGTAAAIAAPNTGMLDPATAAFEAGNLEQAAQLAAQAVKLNPGDAHAKYVMRVVERELQIQAGGR